MKGPDDVDIMVFVGEIPPQFMHGCPPVQGVVGLLDSAINVGGHNIPVKPCFFIVS